MKSQIAKIALIIPLLLLFSSCKDNPTEPREMSITPPTSLAKATMPLSIDNKWAYVDTNLGMGNYWKTRIGVATITSYTKENNTGWWTLSYDDGSKSYLTISNDFVYMKSPKKGLPNPEIEYIPPKQIKDTVLFYQVIPYNETPTLVKVYPYMGEFKTPAGTFDSVYVYDSYELTNRVKKYFKPRVGLLGRDIYSAQDSSTIIYKSRLVYYQLAH